MAVLIGEVDAAIVAVDLPGSFAVRVSPVDLVGSFDPGEDLIEFRFGYQERVVPGRPRGDLALLRGSPQAGTASKPVLTGC